MSTFIGVLDFNAAVDRASAGQLNLMRRTVQRAAYLCVNSIVDGTRTGIAPYSPGTPVDTGFARSGWYTTLSGAGANLADAATQGDPIAQAIAVLQDVQLGQTVWIVNHVPYIVRLEYGWSKQAPAGMVRLTLSAGPEIVAEALAIERRAA